MAQPVFGIAQIQVNGEIYNAKGNFTYHLGEPQREAVVGADRVHGYKEMPRAPFLEGEFTDRGDLSTTELATLRDATITVQLRNGKTLVYREAWYAGSGERQTEEGNMNVRFEAVSAEEV